MEANADWARTTKWLDLEILSTEEGGAEDTSGTVEFRARFQNQRGEDSHHEMSYFSKRQGKWFFTRGKSLVNRQIVNLENTPKRNDPCHCGSGKKFKKCCSP